MQKAGIFFGALLFSVALGACKTSGGGGSVKDYNGYSRSGSEGACALYDSQYGRLLSGYCRDNVVELDCHVSKFGALPRTPSVAKFFANASCDDVPGSSGSGSDGGYNDDSYGNSGGGGGGGYRGACVVTCLSRTAMTDSTYTKTICFDKPCQDINSNDEKNCRGSGEGRIKSTKDLQTTCSEYNRLYGN